MKKTIASLILLSAVSLSAVENTTLEPTSLQTPLPVTNSYGYFDIGLGPFPLPLPVFGLGYRFQRSHHGMDLSVNATTIIAVTQVKGNWAYLYYPNPNLKSQGYFGFGVGPSLILERHKHPAFCLSPEFIFGKDYINDSGDHRFFQAQVSWPTVSFHKKAEAFWFPLVVFNYGFCF
jgi:hypothetical protein